MKNFKTTIAFIFVFAVCSFQLVHAQCPISCIGPDLIISTETDGTIELFEDDFITGLIDPSCEEVTMVLDLPNGSSIEIDSVFTLNIANGADYTYTLEDVNNENLCWSGFTLVLGDGGCSFSCSSQSFALTDGSGTAEVILADLVSFSTANCTDFTIELTGENNTDFNLTSSDESIELNLVDDNSYTYTLTESSTGNECSGVISLFDGCSIVCNDLVNISTDVSGNFTLTPFMLLAGNAQTCGDLEIEVVGINNTDFTATGINALTLNAADDLLFDFTITDLSSNISCIGQISVLDQTCTDTIYVDLVNTNVGIDFVEVEVTALNAGALLSLQFAVLYDGDILSFDSAINGALEVDNSTNEFLPGDLRFAWFSINNIPVSYSNNTVLFTLRFSVVGEGETDMLIGSDDLIFPEAVGPPFNLLCFNTGTTNVVTDGAIISGTVHYNEGYICTPNNPNPLENIIIEISDGTESFFTSTDENGEYSRLVVPGEYTVSASPLNLVWSYCENDITVSLPDLDSEAIVEFIAKADVLCPFMEVNISTPFVRRCFDNTYTVQYCNNGTADAADAYIVVDLEDNLTFVSSNHPDFTIDGQTITFQLGTLGFGCGTLSFVANASCEAEIGETHCAVAEIFPNDPCGRVLGDYAGPVIEVNGFCDGDSVRVNISNTSDENMILPQLFIVVEEDVMIQEEEFVLNALSSMDIALPAQGTTYWIGAQQREDFPLGEAATFTIEDCGVNEDGSFSTGTFNNFSLGDYYPYQDIDCQENIGSFDPNDKNVYPNGYGEEDLIKNNQNLDYKIRFQNTGTDTAFKVIVEDIISPYLDLSTLRMTSSSHTHRMAVDGRTVRFIFENILLVDSLKNEPESHGYVSFTIDMMPDLADDVEINNNADIYFDFNDPIRTNTTHLKIGTDFLDELSSLVEIENSLHIPIQIAPNPANKNTVLELMSLDTQSFQFSLYNIRGQRVIHTQLNENAIDLSPYPLAAGQYMIRLVAEDGKLYAGKIMVH